MAPVCTCANPVSCRQRCILSPVAKISTAMATTGRVIARSGDFVLVCGCNVRVLVKHGETITEQPLHGIANIASHPINCIRITLQGLTQMPLAANRQCAVSSLDIFYRNHGCHWGLVVSAGVVLRQSSIHT